MIESALPPLFRWRKFKKIWFVFFICLATLNITACDYINNKLYPDFKANDVKTPVDKPPFARQNTPPKISIDKIRDIADSNTQDSDDFTVNPVAMKTEMADPKGTKTNQLFADPVKTDEERFSRIETRVQKISDTLNKMSPAITKLIGIEGELDSLTFQLEELINKGKLDQLAMEKNKHQEDIKTGASKTAPKETDTTNTQDSSLIRKIRLGDHPDKTRIVFETTQKLNYTVAIDNDEKIMTITFPKGSFGSNPNAASRQSNIIKSITQTTDSDGAIFAFELTQTAQKLKEMRIPPGAKISRHRIVIDLKR